MAGFDYHRFVEVRIFQGSVKRLTLWLWTPDGRSGTILILRGVNMVEHMTLLRDSATGKETETLANPKNDKDYVEMYRDLGIRPRENTHSRLYPGAGEYVPTKVIAGRS